MAAAVVVAVNYINEPTVSRRDHRQAEQWFNRSQATEERIILESFAIEPATELLPQSNSLLWLLQPVDRGLSENWWPMFELVLVGSPC